MKKNKKDLLKQDKVESNTIHIGIELETIAPLNDCDNDREHDDDACYRAARDNYRDMSNMDILQDYLCLSRENARAVENYFDSDSWVDDMMSDHDCDDDECPHWSSSSDGSETRETIESKLVELVGNNSFKVVSDGSITHDNDETDAEVCWNYFMSRETKKDNFKIMEYLNEVGVRINKSCGLHINLNNYLKVDCEDYQIPTEKLDFLFNFVAPSRKKSSYCNKFAISGSQKYSMIYEQGDRLEFRFFSPTLDAEKLNHYVILAHVIYKRLAGKKAKLPKKSMKYFLDKMTKVNEVSEAAAMESIKKVNSLKSLVLLKQELESKNEEEAA